MLLENKNKRQGEEEAATEEENGGRKNGRRGKGSEYKNERENMRKWRRERREMGSCWSENSEKRGEGRRK